MKGLGHLATGNPVCGGAGGRALLRPPNLHNEPAYCLASPATGGWASPSSPPRVLLPAGSLPSTASLQMLLHFLWWCFRKHEDSSHSALQVLWVAVAPKRSHFPLLPAEGRKRCQAASPRGPAGVSPVPHAKHPSPPS